MAVPPSHAGSPRWVWSPEKIHRLSFISTLLGYTSVFTPIMLNNALHVATAVLIRHDVLLSWNFRHLVNRRRRAEVNEVNISVGLPMVEILAPPEL
jgi:hypothetical protein